MTMQIKLTYTKALLFVGCLTILSLVDGQFERYRLLDRPIIQDNLLATNSNKEDQNDIRVRTSKYLRRSLSYIHDPLSNSLTSFSVSLNISLDEMPNK